MAGRFGRPQERHEHRIHIFSAGRNSSTRRACGRLPGPDQSVGPLDFQFRWGTTAAAGLGCRPRTPTRRGGTRKLFAETRWASGVATAQDLAIEPGPDCPADPSLEMAPVVMSSSAFSPLANRAVGIKRTGNRYCVSVAGGSQDGSRLAVSGLGSAAGAGSAMASATRSRKLRIVAAAARRKIARSSRAPRVPRGGR